MAKQDDPLDYEVTVSAKLDESGLEAGAKSRWISAIDRLLGNAVDLANPLMERYSALSRAKTEAKVDVIKAVGAAAAKEASENPDLARSVAEAIASEHIKKMSNRERIAFKAVEKLAADPNKYSGDNESNNVDDDWLNSFASFAERASSESLQDLWARVLAGEITQPNSFSLTTLRVISELDSKKANLFQKHAKRIAGNLLLNGPNLSGQLLLELTELEQAGFLSGVSGTSNLQKKVEADKSFALRLGAFELRGTGSPGISVSISIAYVTRAGQEVLKILPAASPTAPIDIAASEVVNQIQDLTLWFSAKGKKVLIKKYN